MEGRGCCCEERYHHDQIKCSPGEVDRIMLRYRPIAPKPTLLPSLDVGGMDSSSSTVGGRGKSRFSMEGKEGRRRRGGRRKKRVVSSPLVRNPYPSPQTITLPLMPDAPCVRETTPLMGLGDLIKMVGSPRLKKPQGSTVVVECVMEINISVNNDDPWRCLCWFTEEKARPWLEEMGSPAFISEGFEKVIWVNSDYGKMVGREEEEVVDIKNSSKMLVFPASAKGFTCLVSVKYGDHRKEKRSSTAPCDVWRLVDGKFVWKIDVDAALSLGRR